MFVSESTLLMGTKLEVMSAEGQKWELQIDPSVTIAELKQMAFDKFYTTATIDVGWDSFRVVFPGEYRTLVETHAIHEEKLKDHDILLLVRRRSLVEETLVMDSELKSPTMEEIMAATSQLPRMEDSESSARTTSATGSLDHWSEADFQLELRKIIISLISVMSILLNGNSDADAICKEIQAKIKNRLAHCSDKPVAGNFSYPPPPEVAITPMGIVSGLVEVRKREFRPNTVAFEQLQGLGYTDGEIVEALRITKNSRIQAAHWLSTKERVNLEDVVVGLDPSSRLLNSLVSNPVIRLGLNNPKTFVAFFGLIENPSSANLWLSDSDTAPVLSSIFKLYHADKHL